MFEFSFEDCNSLNISERLAPALTFNRCIFFCVRFRADFLLIA